ncbi:hypothetical protein O181_098301 [Austropuccinia psidii MF-1]|uniref:Uncharacterized protein n=1 Tax=Austropuccinia psidii MF-1 TaxID=1389203 RepID=A0A9Q3JB41_9BASI|nr:hypothetical protein [Austropuccinia psidii MF-1]
MLDQLASHPSRIDSVQDLMDITLELDTRYHERKKEKNHHQEKNPEASNSDSSDPKDSSSSNQKKKKNFYFQKRGKLHSSLLNKDFKLKGSEKDEESRRACEPILVGSIVLRPVSKCLRTSLPSHKANLPAREKPV